MSGNDQYTNNDVSKCLCETCRYDGKKWRGVIIKDRSRVICIKCRTELCSNGNIIDPID